VRAVGGRRASGETLALFFQCVRRELATGAFLEAGGGCGRVAGAFDLPLFAARVIELASWTAENASARSEGPRSMFGKTALKLARRPTRPPPCVSTSAEKSAPAATPPLSVGISTIPWARAISGFAPLSPERRTGPISPSGLAFPQVLVRDVASVTLVWPGVAHKAF